ncbi:MAG TPA: hypothetical protein VIV11_37615 [Kofleriaceae bacterium]
MSRAALAGFVLLLASAAALAQPTPAKRKRAGELATESAKHYKRGEFEVSVALLRQAYALYPEPNLLYNLARSLEGMADKRGAVDAYKRYLANAKRIEDRGALERRIKLLERELGGQAPAQLDGDKPRRDLGKTDADKTKPGFNKTDRTKPDATAKHVAVGTTSPLAEPTFEPPPSRPVDRDEPIGTSAPLADPFSPLPAERVTPPSRLPLLVIGVGVATIGTGFGLGWRALEFEKSAREQMVGLDASEDRARAVSFANTANILFVAGGAVLATGIVWEIFELRAQSKKSDAVTLRPLASGRGLAVEWRLP